MVDYFFTLDNLDLFLFEFFYEFVRIDIEPVKLANGVVCRSIHRRVVQFFQVPPSTTMVPQHPLGAFSLEIRVTDSAVERPPIQFDHVHFVRLRVGVLLPASQLHCFVTDLTMHGSLVLRNKGLPHVFRLLLSAREKPPVLEHVRLRFTKCATQLARCTLHFVLLNNLRDRHVRESRFLLGEFSGLTVHFEAE